MSLPKTFLIICLTFLSSKNLSFQNQIQDFLHFQHCIWVKKDVTETKFLNNMSLEYRLVMFFPAFSEWLVLKACVKHIQISGENILKLHVFWQYTSNVNRMSLSYSCVVQSNSIFLEIFTSQLENLHQTKLLPRVQFSRTAEPLLVMSRLFEWILHFSTTTNRRRSNVLTFCVQGGRIGLKCAL